MSRRRGRRTAMTARDDQRRTASTRAAAGPLVRVRLDISLRRHGLLRLGRAAGAPHRSGCAGGRAEHCAAGAREPRLVVAGRTDAGVHADGQVAHLDLPADALVRGADRLSCALAGVLPADVRVRAIAAAPAAFDARFGALWRRYDTASATSEPASIRCAAATCWIGVVRSTSTSMAAAAAALVGLHDFARVLQATPARHDRSHCAAVRRVARDRRARRRAPCRRTRSATRWFVRWSVRCSPSAAAAGRRRGPRTARSGSARGRGHRRAGARADAGRGGVSTRRRTRCAGRADCAHPAARHQ